MSATTQAGRELDALVAERVMGLQWTQIAPGHAMLHPPGSMHMYAEREGETLFVAYLCPNYSTDIAAAWEVVEKMRETHWTEVDGIGRPDPVWRATFERMPDPETGQRWLPAIQIAPTAPLAICRAALKALG